MILCWYAREEVTPKHESYLDVLLEPFGWQGGAPEGRTLVLGPRSGSINTYISVASKDLIIGS